MINFQEAFELAKKGFDGDNPRKLFNPQSTVIFHEVYAENPNLIDIYRSMCKIRFANPSGLYIASSKIDNNGRVLPKGIYNERLMYHKKWARVDKEVVDVKYDIVGIKRATTHLGPAVLIGNVVWKFAE